LKRRKGRTTAPTPPVREEEKKKKQRMVKRKLIWGEGENRSKRRIFNPKWIQGGKKDRKNGSYSFYEV